MHIHAFYFLFCTLIASQIASNTADLINPESKSDQNTISDTATSSLSGEDFKADENNGFDHNKNKILPLLGDSSSSAIQVFQKANAIKNQYGPLLLKISEMIAHGRSSLNFFGILRVFPYIALALQKVNDISPKNMQDIGKSLGNFNLASALQNPGNLAKIFSDPTRGNLATDAAKVLAGQNASEIIEKLIKEVKAKAIDMKNGTVGIDGEHLTKTILQSDSMKQLFSTEEEIANATVYINAFMSSMANSTNKNQGDNNEPAVGGISGTMMDSLKVFFKTGQRIMNAQLQRINSDAERNVEEWKQAPSNADGNNVGTMKNVIINKTPNAVLKIVATANVLNKQHALLPYIAQYFLPTGMTMDALRFVSLVTYVFLNAQKENMIPDVDIEKYQLQSIKGINTGKIVDTLNDKETMEKIFPLKDQSSRSVAILKFLAGHEAAVVDKLVDEIRRIKSGMDPAQTKITMADLIANTEFVKRTMSIFNSIDQKLKSSLGLDLSGFKNEVIEEMKKNKVSDETSNSNNLVQILSATSAVGLRKTKSKIENFKETVQKEADNLIQAPGSSETETTGARLSRMIANMAPRTALYGFAAANTVGRNLVPSLYSPIRSKALETKDGKPSDLPAVESNVS